MRVNERNRDERVAFKLHVPKAILAIGLVASIGFGFFMGRHVVTSRHVAALHPKSTPDFPTTNNENDVGTAATESLASYSFKTFGVSEDGSVRNTVLSWVSPPEKIHVPSVFQVDENGNAVPATDHNRTQAEVNDYRTSNGVQLFVDISGVDHEFLSSEGELPQALLRLAKECKLTVLSYHCQKQVGGVACIGLLLEGHLSFWTQPSSKTITLDLSVYARTLSSQEFLSSIMDVFGKQSSMSDDVPEMLWSRKVRGLEEESKRVQYSGFNSWLGFTQIEKSTYVASVRTDLHQIDIVDVFESRFDSSSDADGTGTTVDDPRNRMVFFDGELKSSHVGEAAHHEVLVHPAMLTVEDPKRVAILGGGTGAALREVLKHKSVEKVVMIERDEKLVQIAKDYMSTWNDCGFYGETLTSCFDDPRLELHFEDPIDWVIQNFAVEGNGGSVGFDVVIMDTTLKIGSAVDDSSDSHQEKFVIALSRALGDHGTFVTQLGKSPRVSDGLPLSYNAEKSTLIAWLKAASFESVIDYSYGEGFLGSPQSFLLCLKDNDQRTLWFRNEAEFSLELGRRIITENVGASSLRFVDGATMMSLFPSRADEQSWCIDNQGKCPLNGHGYDPETKNFRMNESTKIGVSKIENVGRATYATRFIPNGSFLGLEECTHGIFLPPTSVMILESMKQQLKLPYFHTFSTGYIDGYGWYDFFYGLASGGTDAGLGSFLNHGCNGTYNVGLKLNVTELDADPDKDVLEYYDDANLVYDPYNDRLFPAWGCESRTVLRDIEIGEELFDNYLHYGGGKESERWRSNLIELRSMCMGSDVGLITKYEKGVEIE